MEVCDGGGVVGGPGSDWWLVDDRMGLPERDRGQHQHRRDTRGDAAAGDGWRGPVCRG